MIQQKEGFNGERAIALPLTVIQEMEKDPFLQMLHITDIGYYPQALHHFRERKEPISQYILIYCVEGRGWYRINDKEHALASNQYIVLPAGQPHAYAADDREPWTIYWIHFKGNAVPSLIAGYDFHPRDIRAGTSSRIDNRHDLFEEIFHTIETGYSHENLIYAMSVFCHYLGSICYMKEYRKANRQNVEATDPIAMSIHYMQENLDKQLSLKELTQYTGYSTSHFSQLFVQRTGYAPIAYFNLLKIQKACQLLNFTDMRINQICYKIGIRDHFYFSRLFSKTMGMTPSEYRKKPKG